MPLSGTKVCRIFWTRQPYRCQELCLYLVHAPHVLHLRHSLSQVGPQLLRMVPGQLLGQKGRDLRTWLTVYGYWNQVWGGLAGLMLGALSGVGEVGGIERVPGRHGSRLVGASIQGCLSLVLGNLDDGHCVCVHEAQRCEKGIEPGPADVVCVLQNRMRCMTKACAHCGISSCTDSLVYIRWRQAEGVRC